MKDIPSGNIRCAGCGNMLGEMNAGVFTSKHRQRILVCRELMGIECEDCHTVWSPPHPPAEDGEAGRARQVDAA